MTSVPTTGTLVPIMGTYTNNDSLSTALFGKTRRTVLARLYCHAGESFHLRQIVRDMDIGHGTVQRELKRLSDAGIITRTTSGNQVYFEANQDSPIFKELKALFVKTAGMADVLRASLDGIAGKIDAAFVFGSMAKGDESPDSDVDLMVIGKATFRQVVSALQEAQKVLGREVNPHVMEKDIYAKRKRSKEHFVASLAKTPKVFIIGGENDLGEMG